MRNVSIMWTAKLMPLGRVVLDASLAEAADIRTAAEAIGVPVVEGQVPPESNDLWVGLSPESGWNGLEGETMWARSAEASIIAPRLLDAKTQVAA